MTASRGPRRTKSAPVARRRLQILLEHDRRSISHTDLIPLPREDIFNGGKAMELVKPDKSAPATVTKAVESEKRDLARPKEPYEVDAAGLCSDVVQAGAKSIAEIEREISRPDEIDPKPPQAHSACARLHPAPRPQRTG